MKSREDIQEYLSTELEARHSAGLPQDITDRYTSLDMQSIILGLLMDLRDQNQEIIGVLKAIRHKELN